MTTRRSSASSHRRPRADQQSPVVAAAAESGAFTPASSARSSRSGRSTGCSRESARALMATSCRLVLDGADSRTLPRRVQARADHRDRRAGRLLLAELLLGAGYDVFGIVRRSPERLRRESCGPHRADLPLSRPTCSARALARGRASLRPAAGGLQPRLAVVRPALLGRACADRRVRRGRSDLAARGDPARSTRRSASTRRPRARSSASRVRRPRRRRRRSRR